MCDRLRFSPARMRSAACSGRSTIGSPRLITRSDAVSSSRLRVFVDPIRGVDCGSGRKRELVAPEHGLERRQATQHIGLAADIAHGADAPDLAGKRPERGTDFDSEIIEQLAPDRLAIAD